MVIVSTEGKLAGKLLVCEDCSGTCPRFTDNYDDVMHLPGCPYRARLDIWEKHPLIQEISTTGHLCRKSLTSLNIGATFARNCPEFNKLFSIIMDDLAVPENCRHKYSHNTCYEKYFKEYEDEVLEMAEEFENITLNKP